MKRFLLMGLLRDRSRSLFPFIVTTLGVFITVFLYSFVKGEISDIIETNSRFYTGHVKIMTRAYEKQMQQAPNDLALLNVTDFINQLQQTFPDIHWVPRIKFGGLLDIPDEKGETLEQAPITGLAVQLQDAVQRLNIKDALIRGRLPDSSFELLISDELARKLKVEPGDPATLISSTLYGGMAMCNFTVAGTVHFGVRAMDQSAVLADIEDIRVALNMGDAAGELLGFFKTGQYTEKRASAVQQVFKNEFAADGEFAPTLLKLSQQNDLGAIIEMVDYMSGIIVGVFVFVMSIVLWNTGLMGTLRRYGEFGVRLAIGEPKSHLYMTLIGEYLMIGFLGSVSGTLLGLAASYYMQVHGVNIGDMMQQSSMLMPDVIRARVTLTSYYIGFLPGFLASTVGAGIAGIGIFKRETSQLFKELEVQ
ncbi:MAG: FtsX-like permease family protein [candidate division KSB1 bacterium]|nr:FtsX-like permease family protein [candidate division KSB1 bacterium]